MDSTRQSKIARLIQKELSDIFQQQTRTMHGVLVSVSVCRISPDLSVCRAYLSVFPSERAKEIVDNIKLVSNLCAAKDSYERTNGIFNGITQEIDLLLHEIRYELGQRTRHQLRIIPELKFFVDDSLDYAEHIDELLSQ